MYLVAVCVCAEYKYKPIDQAFQKGASSTQAQAASDWLGASGMQGRDQTHLVLLSYHAHTSSDGGEWLRLRLR